MSEKTLTLRRAVLAAIVAGYGGVPANFTSGNLVNKAASPESISGFRVQGGLAIATDQTARVGMNLRAGTVGASVEVAAHAPQIQPDSNAMSNATDAHVINDVPSVSQNPLFLRHAAERRPAAQRGVHQHFRRTI